MHCPQCGQQQTPGEMRFCSRCGFPLGGVTELLAHGGVMPTYAVESGPEDISPRRRGVKHGVMMIMFGIITTIFFGVLNSYLGTPDLLAALSAVIGFIGGPLRILYALIFEEGAPRYQQSNAAQQYMPPQMQPSLGPQTARPSALPPAHHNPVPQMRPHTNTAEIIRPPSVTENTTRLLEKDPNSPEQ